MGRDEVESSLRHPFVLKQTLISLGTVCRCKWHHQQNICKLCAFLDPLHPIVHPTKKNGQQSPGSSSIASSDFPKAMSSTYFGLGLALGCLGCLGSSPHWQCKVKFEFLGFLHARIFVQRREELHKIWCLKIHNFLNLTILRLETWNTECAQISAHGHSHSVYHSPKLP